MADKKLTELPVAFGLSENDLIYVVQKGISKQIKYSEFEASNTEEKNRVIQLSPLSIVIDPNNSNGVALKIPVTPLIPIWRISGVDYSKTIETIIPIPAASNDMYRVDIIVGNTNNEFVRIQGQERSDVGVPPDIPNDTIEITRLNIFGQNVGDPAPPPPSYGYITKSSKQFRSKNLTTIAPTELLLSTEYTTYSLEVWGGSGIVKGFNQVNEILIYDGMDIFIKNNRNIDIILTHNDASVSIPFWFKSENDFVLKQDEIIQLKYNLANNRVEFVGFVGGALDSIFKPYPDIATMIADQGNQVDQLIYQVIDASGDTNITFESGETKLQAFYRYNGVETGSIDDYTLISAPYGSAAPSTGLEVINVKDFGAVADGVTDDTDAIKTAFEAAKTGNIPQVYFPYGVYIISETLYVSSNITYFGAGKNNSIIRAATTATFDTIATVENNITDEWFYITMIATEGASWDVDVDVENVKIQNLGIDWNGVEVGDYSATPLLLGNIKNSEISDCYFYEALPANLNNTSTRNHGSSILLSFAEDNLITRNTFLACDYENISHNYLSFGNKIEKNYFYIDKPDTYGFQAHAVQTASLNRVLLESQFGTSRTKDVFVEKNTIVMKNNIANGITSHRTDGLNAKNNLIVIDGVTPVAIKPFDDSINFNVDNNTIRAYNVNGFETYGNGEFGFMAISASNNADWLNPSRVGKITNNKIHIINEDAFVGTEPVYINPIIGSNAIDSNDNLLITNNQIIIDGYDNYAKNIISVRGDFIAVLGNTVELINPFETPTTDGISFLAVENSDNVIVGHNIVNGETETYIRDLGGNSELKIGINSWTDALGTPNEETITTSSGSVTEEPTPTSFLKFTNQTTPVILSGLTDVEDGKEVTIWNESLQQMDLLHDSSSALAAERLHILGERDVLLPVGGKAMFRYSESESRWTMIGIFGAGYHPTLIGSTKRAVTVSASGVVDTEELMEMMVWNTGITTNQTNEDLNLAYPDAMNGFTVVAVNNNREYVMYDDTQGEWFFRQITKLGVE